ARNVDAGGDLLVWGPLYLRQPLRKLDTAEPGTFDDAFDKTARHRVTEHPARLPSARGEQVQSSNRCGVRLDVVGMSVGSIGRVRHDDVGTLLTHHRGEAVPRLTERRRVERIRVQVGRTAAHP